MFKHPSMISFHRSEARNVDILTFVVWSSIPSSSGLYSHTANSNESEMIIQHHFPPNSIICFFWNCQKTICDNGAIGIPASPQNWVKNLIPILNWDQILDPINKDALGWFLQLAASGGTNDFNH